jgi:thymidylate synthase
MKTFKANNFAQIYHDLLDEAFNRPHYVTSPRGLLIKELTNIEIHLTDPTNNLFTNYVRSPKLEYLYPELLWYFSGRNDLQFISKYSKFWNNIANSDGTVNSAYGYLLFTELNDDHMSEYEWAYQSLINDRDTRQAILRFNKPRHSYVGNKDFVCTLNGIFHIRERNDKYYLDFTTTMRSQDMWFGIVYDIPFYTLLQQQMLLHLKRSKYPYLLLGEYRHYVLSEHIYQKDFNNVEKMLKYDFIPYQTPRVEAFLIHPNGKPTEQLEYVMNNVLNNRYNFNNDSLLNKLNIHSVDYNNE